MYRTRLREIDGSVMIAVPTDMLEKLKLSAGASVRLAVEDQKLVVEAQSRPVYTIEELLALCDPNAPEDPEEREWLDAPAVGRELI